MFTQNIPSLEALRAMPIGQLEEVCKTLACWVLEATNQKEAHMASSFSVAELTVALHYVYNTPKDILVWDVGHQAYLHKALTDRQNALKTNRLQNGISGFTSRAESVFDPFGAGHSSTSISAVGGFAMAAKMQHIHRKHIAVIGDGALTGGMAYEALNHLGVQNVDVLLILNDNESSIDPTIGALHEFQGYQEFFESLGWGYSGPIDGHDLPQLVYSLQAQNQKFGVRVLHIKTKQKTYSAWRNHFGLPPLAKTETPQNQVLYQDVFAEKLMLLAEQNAKIVAITPAMLSGSGLAKFQKKFATRCFDVGIAEQHAVTLAAGMAASGLRPLVHLYSTFAQRAFDQIIHDVALQNLPVVFVLDRAGLVGEDGATHHGAFDLSFLNAIPNLQILAPMHAADLRAMLAYAFTQNGPVVIRFPRGGEVLEEVESKEISTSSFEVLQKGTETVLVSLGVIGQEVAKVCAENPSLGHINLRFLKPWNDAHLAEALKNYTHIVTAEEGSLRGGLRDSMASWAQKFAPEKTVRGIGLPDTFVPHGSPMQLASKFGLDAAGIAKFLAKS